MNRLYKVFCRYGKTLEVEPFWSDMADLKRGRIVVVRTARGRELAQVMTAPEPAEETSLPDHPRVVRAATVDDLERQRELQNVRERSARDFCLREVARLGLKMRLLEVEYLFGGEKILFYYVAQRRVDFRELVRILARHYRTRIEMKQIGIRDAARLLLDYSHCGRPLCCRSFLQRFDPVTVRTARLQKTTLDPGKISGACGRLMCCLLFENDFYEEMARSLPERGERVRTADGEGVVFGRNVIQQTVMVALDGGDRRTYAAGSVERIGPPPGRDGDDEKSPPEE